MTVGAMLDVMSHREYADWMTFFRQRGEESERAGEISLDKASPTNLAAMFGRPD